MLDSATLAEVGVLLGLVGGLATMIIFIWSQRKAIDEIKINTLIEIKESRSYRSEMLQRTNSYGNVLNAITKEHDNQTQLISALVTSHGEQKMTLGYMEKMFDKVEQTIHTFSESVIRLSVVLENQATATHDLVTLLDRRKIEKDI